jgi:putative redox protein
MTIMGLVADRHQLDLSGTAIRVEKEMASTPVRRIASLKTKVTFPAGLDLQPEMRDRLVAAARKCPVHQSLHPDIDAPIDFVDLD